MPGAVWNVLKEARNCVERRLGILLKFHVDCDKVRINKNTLRIGEHDRIGRDAGILVMLFLYLTVWGNYDGETTL